MIQQAGVNKQEMTSMIYDKEEFTRYTTESKSYNQTRPVLQLSTRIRGAITPNQRANNF